MGRTGRESRTEEVILGAWNNLSEDSGSAGLGNEVSVVETLDKIGWELIMKGLESQAVRTGRQFIFFS